MKTTIVDEPNIQIEKLKIWIHGRQFPDVQDYWDANWLNVTAQYDSFGSSVRTSGSIMQLSEIASFLQDCKNVHQALAGTIELACMEPNLHLKLEADKLGHLNGKLEITSDHMLESHEYEINIDQSFLPELIKQCVEVLKEYPMKEAEKKN